MPKGNNFCTALSKITGFFYHLDFPRPGSGSLAFLVLFWFTTPALQAQKIKGPKVISIQALDGLQYDIVRFKVKPGEKIKITLGNVSDMSHNLLIVRPGTTMKVVEAALQLAEKGPKMDFIPGGNDVLWSIPLISPGQTRSLTFTAPAKPGIYPYVCTFPGHGFIMYGAMYVMQEGNMPDIKKDKNIPDSRRQEDRKNKNELIITKKTTEKKDTHPEAHVINVSAHPYELKPPYLYHTFLEGRSPAALAVNLPKELSYCWDSEACRLRFAWKGDFLDMSDLWKGHFNASAKVLGDIFFRDQTEFPLRLGADKKVPATIQYKGYRLVDAYPEFHYIIDGLEVFELIKEKPEGDGLVRSFRMPRANLAVWFFTNKEENAFEYECAVGRWQDGKLELSPTEAKSFTITQTSYYLAYKYKKK